jgi:hypothetical protein
MTGRLRQLEQLLTPRVVAPRTAPDDAIETGPPLIAVQRHLGRLYVVGHEPHFRAITLLQPIRGKRRAGSDPA